MQTYFYTFFINITYIKHNVAKLYDSFKLKKYDRLLFNEDNGRTFYNLETYTIINKLKIYGFKNVFLTNWKVHYIYFGCSSLLDDKLWNWHVFISHTMKNVNFLCIFFKSEIKTDQVPKEGSFIIQLLFNNSYIIYLFIYLFTGFLVAPNPSGDFQLLLVDEDPTWISEYSQVCVEPPTHRRSAGRPPNMTIFVPHRTRTQALRGWVVVVQL